MRSLPAVLLLSFALRCFSAPLPEGRLQGLGALLAARSLYLSGDPNSALRTVRSVVKRFPAHLYARNFEAEILFSLYKKQKKEIYLNGIFRTLYAALERGSYNRTFFNLARYHLFRGEQTRAIGMYRDGLQLRFNENALHEYMKLSIRKGSSRDRIWGLYRVAGNRVTIPGLLYISALQLLRHGSINACERFLYRCTQQDTDYFVKIKALHARSRVLIYQSRYREALLELKRLGKWYRNRRTILKSMLSVYPVLGELPGRKVFQELAKGFPSGFSRLERAVYLLASGKKRASVRLLKSLPISAATASCTLLAGVRGSRAVKSALYLLENLRGGSDRTVLRFWYRKIVHQIKSPSDALRIRLVQTALDFKDTARAGAFLNRLKKSGLPQSTLLPLQVRLRLESIRRNRKSLISGKALSGISGAKAFHRLAMLFLKYKRYDEGAGLLRFWRTRRVGDPVEKLLRANLFCLQRRFKKAADLISSMQVQRLPGHFRNLLAYSLAQCGTGLDRGMQLIDRLLVQKPFNPSYLDTKGWLLFKKKKYKNAEQWIRRALVFAGEQSGERWEIMEHLGDVLAGLKRAKEAVSWYRKSLSDTDGDHRNNIKSKIKNLLKQGY